MKKTVIILALAGWALGIGISRAELGAGNANPSLKAMVKKGRAALKAGRLEKAFEWFLKGAKKEDPEAENMAGVCFENGIGTHKDEREAATWFKKSALQNNADGENNWANCNIHGYGTRVDNQEAFKYYHLAATHGSAAAAYNLGYSYENGFGLPTNLEAAKYFYKLAAKRGSALAQSRLRQMER